MRCPKRFLPIHQQSHFNQSLKTDSKAEAEALAPLVKQRVLLDWEARLAGTASEDDRTTYERTLALAKTGGSNLLTMDELVAGDFNELLGRIRDVKTQDPSGQSAYFAALSEVAVDMERLLESEARDQNPRQLSGWRNKWKRAAKNFADACEEKAIKEITVNDAYKLRRHWLDLSRFDAAPLIAFTATKEINYGTETDGRISARCGAYRADQWAYTQAGG
jgi:hypothetical protein